MPFLAFLNFSLHFYMVYNKNIYGSKKIHLPYLYFVLFYNGLENP